MHESRPTYQVADTEAVADLVDRGAQVLEVLPPSAYRREHLPGARNLPMPQLTEDRLADLDRMAPVVVYCYDTECDLSSRAAALLAAHGFTEVYDYRGSKTAWAGSGHPLEGEIPPEERAGGVLVEDVPRCGPDATVGDLVGSFDGSAVVVVVDADGIVLGDLRPEVLALDPATPVLAALHPAPASVRPSIPVTELAESMDGDGQDHVLVTTLAGRLLGLVRRADLHRDG